MQCISEGFALWDANDRLVVCNPRYREIFASVAPILEPGLTFTDMVYATVEAGVFRPADDKPTQRIRDRLEAHRNPGGSEERRLTDGRWLRTTEWRTPDGCTITIHADVTELKRREAALQASEKRHRNFAALASDWQWETDENHRFIYFSESYERSTGQSPSNVMGKTRFELSDGQVDGAAWRQHLDDLDNRREFRDFAYAIRFPDGDVRWFSTSGSPQFDDAGGFVGYQGTATDITERKMAEQILRDSHELLEQRVRERTAELAASNDRLREQIAEREQVEGRFRESRRRFQAIFNLTFQFIGLLEPDGTVLEVNQTALDFTGQHLQDVVGCPFWETAWWSGSSDSRERLKLAIASAAAGEFVRYEDTMVGTSGRSIEIDFSLKPIFDDAGNVILLIPEGRDVSDRVRAQEALRERDARLKELQAELLHVSRVSTVGQLSSALAHELNQPLSAIMNYVQAAKRLLEASDKDFGLSLADVMEKAIVQADRAGEIIRHLRAFLEKGETERTQEDVNQVIEEACTLALAGTEGQGIEVSLDQNVEAPPVLIDRIQIQQVVLNLVRNGIEAMGASEVRKLSVKTAEVSGDAIEVSVSDTGSGLSDEARAHLFQPFFTTKANGMGIGLSICRSIVQAHGGRLWAEANPGGGTVFSFTVPIASVEDIVMLNQALPVNRRA